MTAWSTRTLEGGIRGASHSSAYAATPVVGESLVPSQHYLTAARPGTRLSLAKHDRLLHFFGVVCRFFHDGGADDPHDENRSVRSDRRVFAVSCVGAMNTAHDV